MKILLTGGSGGIGNVILKKLQSDNDVIAPSSKELNLLHEQSVDDFVKDNHDKFDIIINCAGVNLSGGNDNIKYEDLNSTMSVNLISPIRLTNGLLTKMKTQSWGRILNISSILGVISGKNKIPYVVSKTGLVGWTRSLALELASNNILINCLSPGYVDVYMKGKTFDPEGRKILLSKIPMGRLSKPEEIAEAVSWLVSEKNTYITGQNIIIDGGYTIQ